MWRDEHNERHTKESSAVDSKVTDPMKRSSPGDLTVEETKRIGHWLALVKLRPVFGFNHLNSSELPAMSTKSRGLTISFEKITGWKLPPALDISDGDFDFSLNLSLSLFHLKSGSFFGSSWTGAPISIHPGNSIDISCSDLIYFITRVNDPSCVGVVEFVVSKIHAKKNMTIAQYGCGWTLLNLFGSSDNRILLDINDNSSVTASTCSIFDGSPRDLVACETVDKLLPSLNEMKDCFICFRLMAHKKLLIVEHLVSENEIIDRFDAIVGLAFKKVTPPGFTCPKWLPCIGDEERVDGKKGPYLLPTIPLLAPYLRLTVQDCIVYLPGRLSFESRIRNHAAAGLGFPPGSRVDVLSRVLKIGIHNGHTIVSGEMQYSLLNEDKEEQSLLVASQSSIVLDGYVADEVTALVVILEYEIGLESAPTVYGAAALRSSFETVKNRSNVTVGAAVYIPFDGCALLLKNSTDHDGVELKLSRDDVCSAVSSKPIYLDWDDATGRATDDISLEFDLEVSDSRMGRSLAHGEIIHAEVSEASPENDHAEFSRMRNEAFEGSRKADKDSARSRNITKDSYESRFGSFQTASIVRSSVEVDGMTVEARQPQLSSHYYASGDGHKDVGPSFEMISVSSTASSVSRFLLPRDALMSKVLQSRLSTLIEPIFGKPSSHRRLPENNDEEYIIESRPRSSEFVPFVQSPTAQVSSFSRALSRSTRSRLNRHGIDGIVKDSVASHFTVATIRPNVDVVDINIEATDTLSLHDVTIQFAGYRAAHTLKSPKSVYFSFQFYTCQATKTESMRLLPANDGQVCVLARDGASSGYIENPLGLRYMIDCSAASPYEGFEFSEYLATSVLYVNIWDASSSLYIGTCGVPLRKLMRQGQPSVKHALECDVINPDSASTADGGAALSAVFVRRGAISGTLVGAVQIVISNFGQRGRGPHVSAKKDGQSSEPDFDMLNWRAHGSRSALPKGSHRPKNSVRARPLAESTPELAEVLQSSLSEFTTNASIRSLSTLRGIDTNHTLTYDDVLTLFKRFQGSVKGTIQYEGSFLKLLDTPSSSAALKKIVRVFTIAQKEGLGAFEKELRCYSDVDGYVTYNNLRDFFRSTFDKYGVSYREDEHLILSRTFTKAESESVNLHDVLSRINQEANSIEWSSTAKFFRMAVQKAYISGLDVEQLFTEYDTDGDDYVTLTDFKQSMNKLIEYGLSSKHIATVVKRFGESGPKSSKSAAKVSLKEVLAFLGKDYVGNLEARVRKIIRTHFVELGAADEEFDIARRFRTRAESKIHPKRRITYEDLSELLGDFGVHSDLSKQQFDRVVNKIIQVSGIPGVVTVSECMQALGFSAGADAQSSLSTTDDAEILLRLLLTRVQSNGIAVDEAFRHFDQNGDGLISEDELTQGLNQLAIFDSIPNWTGQVNSLIKKFDTSGDGNVSLKEFFAFLGFTDYAPNIVQRMTKIFAVATDKGLSFENIFKELDENNDGNLSAPEVARGLEKLGTFNDVSESECAAVISMFDDDKNGRVSLAEFVKYFSVRVQKEADNRRRKKRLALVERFKKLLQGAFSKGLKPSELFAHLDQDRGGSVSVRELSVSLSILHGFKELSLEDVREIACALDTDQSGDISLKEFERFAASAQNERVTATFNPVARIKALFNATDKQGLSVDEIFSHIAGDDSKIDYREFGSSLKELSTFQDISSDDIKNIFDIIDIDRSGSISLRELKQFIEEEQSTVLAKTKSSKSKNDDFVGSFKSKLVKEFQRISDLDGGIEGLLAYLDEDEDGLISLSSLIRTLRREGVFETIDVVEAERVFRSLSVDGNTKGSNVNVVSLLRYLEGRTVDEVGKDSFVDSELECDYVFSNDPEVRSLEKKLRSLGRSIGNRGINIEDVFRSYDVNQTGMVHRTEFFEAISKLDLYILEKGRALTAGAVCESEDDRVRLAQKRQISRLQGRDGSYAASASRLAHQMVQGGANSKDFKDHMESMAMIKWHRESQKRLLLQRVLSHSLSSSIFLYPRLGTTLFFEYPITNPFGHEERFLIDTSGDSELRLVTSFDEWIHLRQWCRPGFGKLGPDPVEAEMFDKDGYGNIQIALLPHETVHLPFAFMTLKVPFPSKFASRKYVLHEDEVVHGESKHGASEVTTEEFSNRRTEDTEVPSRVIEVRIVSGTHGHIIALLKANIYPRPQVVNRFLQYYEPENSVMKRRILLRGYGERNLASSCRSLRCVEADRTSSALSDSPNKLTVGWDSLFDGESLGHPSSADAVMLLRYRCDSFPSSGSFYILVFEDQYQSILQEVWSVRIETRQRLEIHGSLGSTASVDLVVRGDRFSRRVRAYSSIIGDNIAFQPEVTFQLVPVAYNRVVLNYKFQSIGRRETLVNLVDVDSKELINAWLLKATGTAPTVLKAYDVEVPAGSCVNKKIIFKNPWTYPRRFQLVSSDPDFMKPRAAQLDVASQGSAYLRLLFDGSSVNLRDARCTDVYLFLNDEEGNNEECFQFRLRLD